MLQLCNHPEGLDIMVKPSVGGHALVEFILAGMTERRVAKVVGQGDGLGEIVVQAEGVGDRTGDLRNFQRMGQSRTKVIALVGDEHLRFFLQTTKCRRVDNPISVAGEGRTGSAWRLGEAPANRLLGVGGETGRRSGSRGLGAGHGYSFAAPLSLRASQPDIVRLNRTEVVHDQACHPV